MISVQEINVVSIQYALVFPILYFTQKGLCAVFRVSFVAIFDSTIMLIIHFSYLTFFFSLSHKVHLFSKVLTLVQNYLREKSSFMPMFLRLRFIMFFNTFILSLKLKNFHVIVLNALPLLSFVISIGSFCNSFVLSPNSIPEEVLYFVFVLPPGLTQDTYAEPIRTSTIELFHRNS